MCNFLHLDKGSHRSCERESYFAEGAGSCMCGRFVLCCSSVSVVLCCIPLERRDGGFQELRTMPAGAKIPSILHSDVPFCIASDFHLQESEIDWV